MTSQSSYSRGDSFENKTYELLKTLLINDEFYVPGKKSKVFRKKRYYSDKRKSDIIFDISIETYLNDSGNYSLLTLIECKNYQSPVPINDIEEFDSKIRQISEHNTKGIIITNNSFQSGATSFAFSTGIGLARVTDNDKFEWLIHRKINGNLQITMSDAVGCMENRDGLGQNFLAINGQFVLRTFAELLLQLQIIDFFKYKEKFINIPYVTKEKIETIVTRLEALMYTQIKC